MKLSSFLFLIVILLHFTIGNIIHAQSGIDSLKIQVSKETDYEKQAAIFYEIANHYYSENLDSSIHYAKQYLQASKNINDTFWIADAQNLIAYAFDAKGDVELALEYFQKALDNFLILKDSFYIASTYTNIGYMTSYGLDQAKGLSYFLEAMQIAEVVNDSGLLSDITANIGYYYDRVDDNNTALRYYQNSLEYSLAFNDSVTLSYSYANLAGINIKMKNLVEAESNLLKSKQMISDSYSNYELCYIYSSLAECYLDWQQIDSAQLYFNKAENILTNNEFAILEAYVTEQKGSLAFLKKEYRNSLKYFDKSIVFFKNINTIEPLPKVYRKQAAAYSELKMHNKAYNTLKIANSLTDSLGYGILANMLGEFEQKRIHQVNMKNLSLEEELTNQKLVNTEIKLKSNTRITVFSIFFLIIIIIIVLYFYGKIRKKNVSLKNNNFLIKEQKALVDLNVKKLKKSEKELKELNATKDKFFSIIGHDLKNPFSSVISFTDLLLEDKELRESEKIIPILNNLNKTAYNGYNLLGDLLEWSRSQTGSLMPKPEKIQINQALEEAVTDLDTFASKKNIKFDIQVDSPVEVLADENMVKTVLRNLMHNAIKFSFENSIINISSVKKGNVMLTTIQDQGIGISKNELSGLFAIDNHLQKEGTNNEKGSGLGLILCKEFVTKNRGEIWAEGQEQKGCKFNFTLPLYYEEDKINFS